MIYPNQNQMETNMMTGKGQLGIKKIPAHEIPKQSQSSTRTGNSKSNFDVNKKMKKVMNKVMGGK